MNLGDQNSSTVRTDRRGLLSEESARTLAAFRRLKPHIEAMRTNESDFVKLIDVVDDTRSKWKAAEIRRTAAEEQSGRLERARTNLEREIKTKETDFLSLQEESLGLRNKVRAYEEKIVDYENRLGTLRTVVEKNLKNSAGYDQMLKLSRLSRPLPPIDQKRASKRGTSIGFIDDDTQSSTAEEEDEVRLRYDRRYRRSQSQGPETRRASQTKRTRASRHETIDEERENADPRTAPPSAKRSREVASGEITTVTTITMDVQGRTPTRASVEVRRSKKRSVSASRILDDKPNKVRRQLTPRSPRLIPALSSNDLRRIPTAISSSWTQGRAIEECGHNFAPMNKSRLFSMLMTNACACCNSAISSTAGVGMTCKDCQLNVHTRCKTRAPMPCLPAGVFPTEAVNPKTRLNLLDICPVRPPFIPALILRCILALDQNRLATEGIYRVSGDKKAVEDLYAEFMKQKFVPDLSIQPTEVICGTITKFLRTLKDPVIPRSSFFEFVKAAECEDAEEREQQLCEAICELPLPNQDTLAFLCLHLQKVASFSSDNRMPAENLARVFAPTLLNSGQTTGNMGKAEAEVHRSMTVVRELLHMQTEFWSEYLKKRTASTAPVAFGTPRTHVIDFKNETSSTGRQAHSRVIRWNP